MSYNKETEMYEGYIYKITNTVNDKAYIGQTSRTVNERWKEHQRMSLSSDGVLYTAIHKYGIDKFQIEEIERFSCHSKDELFELLDRQEIYWISLFDTYCHGYNSTHGGQFVGTYDYAKKSVQEFDMQRNLMRVYDSVKEAEIETGISSSCIVASCKRQIISTGGKFFRYIGDCVTVDDLEKYKLNFPTIYQFDHDGNLLNCFNNIREARKYLESVGIAVYESNISACVHGKMLSAAGFIWRKYPDSFYTYEIPEKIKFKACKKIEKRSIVTGELIDTYNNLQDVASYNNFNQVQVHCVVNCCSKYIASANGYHWCYADEFDVKQLERINQVPVDVYSKNGEYLKSFKSITESKQYLNLKSISVSTITAVCDGKRKSAYGYVWRYPGESFDKYDSKTNMRRKINVYSLDECFLQTLEYVSLAKEMFGINDVSAIYKCCKHQCGQAYGHKWFYADDQKQPDKTKILNI